MVYLELLDEFYSPWNPYILEPSKVMITFQQIQNLKRKTELPLTNNLVHFSSVCIVFCCLNNLVDEVNRDS